MPVKEHLGAEVSGRAHAREAQGSIPSTTEKREKEQRTLGLQGTSFGSSAGD